MGRPAREAHPLIRAGLRIRDARKQRGLTLESLAALLHCSVGYLSDLETGKRANPSAQLLQDLSKALGSPVEHLIGEDLKENLDQLNSRSGFNVEEWLRRMSIPPARFSNLFDGDLNAIARFIQTFAALQDRYGIDEQELLSEWNRVRLSLDPDHFQQLETWAARLEQRWQLAGLSRKERALQIEALLLEQRVRVDHLSLAKLARNPVLKSVYRPELRVLQIETGLGWIAQTFLMVRELLFHGEIVGSRSLEYPSLLERTLAQVRNNHTAWHLALLLTIPPAESLDILRRCLQFPDPQNAIDLLQKYVSVESRMLPELLFARLTHSCIIEYKQIPFFLVVDRKERANGMPYYDIGSHLFPVDSRIKHFARAEAHCRRWKAIRLLEEYNKKLRSGELAAEACLVGIQKSRFTERQTYVVTFTVAFMGPEAPRSVSIGLPAAQLLDQIVFFGHPELPAWDVGETCDTCIHFEHCDEKSEYVLRHSPLRDAGRREALRRFIHPQERKKVGRSSAATPRRSRD